MEYEYGKIRILNQNLQKHNVNKNIYNSIMKGGELIRRNCSNAQKSLWFYNAMNTMDNLLDTSLKRIIREDCACCLAGKRQKICQDINMKYSTDEERIKAINETHFVFGNEIKIIGKGKYEVSFFEEKMPIKKCVCLKDLNKKMSITYCYCCGGHVKHHLETVLGKKIKVRVISSAISSNGKKNCKFELKEV